MSFDSKDVRRSLVVLFVLGFIGIPFLRASPAFPPSDSEESSEVRSVPEGVTATDWASIREAHEGWKHRFLEHRDGTISATNPGQQWRMTFEGRGFTAETRDQTWVWGLELTGYGLGDHRRPVSGTTAPELNGTRLSYARDKHLEEWFVNDGRGLEQGWTLTERPSGSGEATLTLDLTVRGGLRPEVDALRRSVTFSDEDGAAAITYGGLKAWDATGRSLPVWFAARDEVISVNVDDRAATYPVTIDPIAQQAYLKASNPGANDNFGCSVSVSGDTVVIGSRFEDSHTSGVDSTPDDDGMANNSGAAYVFVRNGVTWSQQAYLKASNPGTDDYFGISVSVSGDTLVVGAHGENSNSSGVNTMPDDDGMADDSGAAYVFVRSGETWSEQAYLKPSNHGAVDQFGWAVAVSGDTVVVGARLEDSNTSGVDTMPDDDGMAIESGAAYVFTRSGETWSEQAYLKPSNQGAGDQFGSFVAIAGDTVVIGAPFEDSHASGVNRMPNDDGMADESGAAYIFVRSGVVWSEQAYLKSSNPGGFDSFGGSVSVSGDTVVVGAFQEDSDTSGVNSTPTDSGNAYGAAYVFVRSADLWSQQAYLKASNPGPFDYFGCSVSVFDDTIVVGAFGEDSHTNGVGSTPDDDGMANESGAAYVFHRSGDTWSEQAYLKASNTGAFDGFGRLVAVSGDTLIVGATGEDSNTAGVDSLPNDDGLASSSGAAYLFALIPDPPIHHSPTLRVKGKKKIITSRVRHTLRGTAADADRDLRRVEARDIRPLAPRRFRSALGNYVWRYFAPLKRGRNVVRIRAVDATGRFSRLTHVTIIKR